MISHQTERPEAEETSKREAEQKLQWASRLDRHLARAAKLASDYGVPPDAFASAAWNAYVNQTPGLAEHIEQMKFFAALEELRQKGQLATA
jgi:hypothetical protein